MLKEDLKYITTEYLRKTNQLSVRTANCCIKEGLDNFYKILLFFEENGSFLKKKIKNAGRKTCEELDELCLSIIPDIETEKQYNIVEIDEAVAVIQALKEQEREILLSIAVLISNTEKIIREKSHLLSNNRANIFSFTFDFCMRNGYFPMFWILEQQLVSNDNRNIKILIDAFSILQNYQYKTLEDIAEKYNLTRERVRQIRNNVFRETFEITEEVTEYKENNDLVKFIELLQNREDWEYVIEYIKGEHSVSQSSNNLKNCLIREQCSLSPKFALQIIGYIFRDKFTLYGGFDINNRGKYWKSTLLIRKEFTDIFDFEKMKEEFCNILSNNETGYFLDIENYISNSQSWINFDFDKINEITSIARTILLNEYGLYSEEIDGKIKIPANKERKPLDIVYEILHQNGKPMHLNEIFAEFKRLLPEHKYTQEDNSDKLRPFLQKHELISYRNRSSIYMLKEWKHIRSGTIRDAIMDFLSENDIPQSADNIAEYVFQHYPKTNVASIRTTMLNDTLKRFSFFGNNLFGLKSKVYPSRFKEVLQQEGQRKSFEQRLNDLEKFIIKNEHFPFASSKDKEEKVLCHWWTRVASEKKLISEIQQKEVERIKYQYRDYDVDRNKYEWSLNYNKLRIFLIENKRVPSAKGEEKYLYSWLRKVKDDFLNYRLSDKQRKKYIELAKMI